MRFKRRTDANQTDVVEALRDRGYPVQILSGCGMGIPDLSVLICPMRGISLFLELKDGAKPPSAQKTTPAEDKFIKNNQWNTRVVNSVESALAAIEEFELMIKGM